MGRQVQESTKLLANVQLQLHILLSPIVMLEKGSRNAALNDPR